MRSLGTSTGEFPKTPTLRQAIAARLDIPTLNLVTTIFKPGKFTAISLICEDKFRVNVREEEPLYRDLYALFPDIVNEKIALFVRVPEGSTGRYELLVDETSYSEWTEFHWGFRMEAHDKHSKRAGKKPRATIDVDNA